MIEAKMFLNYANRGITKPKFFLCDDNNVYLIKFNHPKEYNRILLNEYYAYCIANILDIPIPKMNFIYISPDLCKLYPNIDGLTPGIKVGFLKEDIEDNSTATGKLKEPYIKLFSKVENKEVFPAIFAFDSLIHNYDRTGNEGNIILTYTSYNRYKMKLIDHGHAFYGPIANPERLYNLLNQTNVDLNPLGIIYDAIKGYIDLTKGDNPFIDIINKIEAIEMGQLINISNNVPESWNIDIIELNALNNFIYRRKFLIKYLIQKLVNNGYFPLWTKEELPWNGLLVSSL